MKKQFLWILIIIVCFSMISVFAFAGCKADAGSGKYKIVALCANFDDKWMSYMHEAMEEAAVDFADVAEITLVDAANEVETQVSQAEDAVAAGADAVVLVCLNTVEDSTIPGICNDAGVVCVSINRTLKNQDECAAYVGSDSLIAGELEMGELAKLCEGKGKVAIMQGILQHEATIARTEGFYNVMESYPDMEVVLEDTANFSRDEAQTLMENWIQGGTEFNIIACNNDEMAIGAILALQSQGIDPAPYFIGGIDGTPDALDYMQQGLEDCSVYQNPGGQGYGGIETAIKILDGETVDEIVWIPYELITQDDIDEYLARW